MKNRNLNVLDLVSISGDTLSCLSRLVLWRYALWRLAMLVSDDMAPVKLLRS
jgi:hypothetical protein